MKRVSSIVSLLLVVLAVAGSAYGAPVTKEWTLAVYLNADNNLDPFGVEDQNEMAKIGSNNWLNMVTLIDREQGPAQYNYIEKGKITKIKDMGELDMGDSKQLVDFMKFIVANYPAKKYILTIWNHGSGWKLKKGDVYRGVSYDDSSNNHITNDQLGVALKEIKGVLGKNIDILNFDACLMAMVEVAYECRDSVDYIVASEETEPGKGTPYDGVFKGLTQAITVEAFTKYWVKAFVGSYSKKGSQGNEACTQSSIKCSALNNLNDALNGFAKATMAGKFSTEFAAALGQVQKFAYPENIDVIHFAKLIQASVKDPAMQTACTKVLDAAKAAVVANGNAMDSMKNALGIAIYFPEDSSSYDSPYNSLNFSKDFQWAAMVKDFYKKKTATALLKSVESGDLSALRNHVAKSTEKDREINKFVADQLNFRLHTEAGLPASTTEEASGLVKELSQK